MIKEFKCNECSSYFSEDFSENSVKCLNCGSDNCVISKSRDWNDNMDCNNCTHCCKN